VVARNVERNPGEPRPEEHLFHSFGGVFAERPVGTHEALLCDVLGVVRASQDAQASAEDGDLLALDQEPKRATVAAQDGIDEAAIIHGPIVPRCRRHLPSVVPARA
jgi:hypothetical protein